MKRRPSLSHHFWEEEDKQMSLNNFAAGHGLAGGSLTKSQKSRMKSWRISKRISKLGCCCCCWKDPFLLLSPKAKLSSLGWDCSSKSKHYKKCIRQTLLITTIENTKQKLSNNVITPIFSCLTPSLVIGWKMRRALRSPSWQHSRNRDMK